MSLSVTSASFTDGEAIPRKHAYVGEGDNLSPQLAWSGLPDGTQEVALVCDDPDAPTDEPWVHWVAYKIPPSVRELAEGDPGELLEGANGWGEKGWGGPMPPKGGGKHRYCFKLYALGSALELASGASKTELLAAMSGHVLGEAELVGTYERT